MRWFRGVPDVDDVGAEARIGEEVARLSAAVAQERLRLEALENLLKQTTVDIERAIRGVIKEHQDDYSRLAAGVESVRQSVSGLRGGRPAKAEAEIERQALELGRRVMQACQTPEGAMELAQQIQAQAAGASGHPKVNAFGEPIRNGREL